ncbi:MICOS complex subunit MIC26-like [Pholidichthys leucotaenia]
MPGEPPSSAVYAAAGSGDGEKYAAAPLNRDDLCLYTAPQQESRRFSEPEPGQLEETVATLRQAVQPYTVWCRGTLGKIKPKVLGVVQFADDAYSYLKDPPKDFYPRAGVIGFTGVVGLLLARGSRFKKLLYPAGLMTVSASMYYPEQAAAIAKSTGDSVYECAVQGYAAAERLLNPPPAKADKKGTDSQTKP